MCNHVPFTCLFNFLCCISLISPFLIPQVSLELNNATVIYDQTRHTPESLAEAIDDMGFESSLTNSAPIAVPTETKMFTKAGCSTDSIQQALSTLAQMKGVVGTQESTDNQGLAVTFVPSLVSVEQLGEMASCLVPDAVGTPASGSQEVPASRSTCRVEQVKMRIEGMVCLSCTTTIEGKIGKLKGVEKIKGITLRQV